MARVRVDRAYLTASFVTAYIVGSNVEATFIEMVFHNTDTVVREVEVREVPSGSTPGDEHTLVKWTGQNALRPKEMRGFSYQPALGTGDSLRWKSDADIKVTAALFANEETL